MSPAPPESAENVDRSTIILWAPVVVRRRFAACGGPARIAASRTGWPAAKSGPTTTASTSTLSTTDQTSNAPTGAESARWSRAPTGDYAWSWRWCRSGRCAWACAIAGCR
jgi:hypothetical protein